VTPEQAIRAWIGNHLGATVVSITRQAGLAWAAASAMAVHHTYQPFPTR
jgi:hypothetical protein